MFKALQATFNMEANTMNPDQTAPKGGSLIWVPSTTSYEICLKWKEKGKMRRCCVLEQDTFILA